ncbi:uncharacterized protein JCM15063_001960 [Sporobolomyces koalae]|uniref:uncharacterized protein n=1 Tax=Sporobolomyces koalae TaxID=500713 RepID=UPI0031782646
MPPTPLVPVGWETPDATGADLQQTQNDRDHVLPTEPVPHSYDPKLCAVPRQTEAASLDFPASASATTRGLLVVGAGLSVPFPSSSSLADLQPPPPRRQPKTSESTFVSTYSGDSIESPSNSGPGTPGEDNTLAFIFDSYRYSRSSSAASFGGPSFRTDLPGMRPALALDELQLVEEVIDAQGTETAEMSDAWTNRVRRRDAASALPARLSPNRSRSSSRSEAEVVSRSSAARAKERHILDNHPEVEQSGLPPAAGSQDYCSDHAALLLEQKAASAWSSGGANDLSPQNSDVFADSPTSSLAARSSALARDVQSPSSQTSLNLGQSRTGVYYPAEGPAGSPAAASFQTAASTDRFQDSSAAEDSDRSQTHNVATTPVRNKLRKKPSFRLRKSSATESDLDISNVAPPLPRLADQIGNDHLDTASPPRSPARQLLRKNSIGSKFSRKSSEAAQKKRIDYGTGISNKDFEEETIQIGASAFEIVKPYAALVVRDQEPLDDLASLDSPDSSALSHNDHYVDPYHLSNPATPSHLGNSFSNAQSHFSPPTPQSVEGDHRSVQDHRARELKWVQTLSSGLSAAQLRKSKKMRTLVYGGIPSSVRGKVWSFLAESDREREPELFARLSSKGPSRHSAAYEQDLDTLLLDHPQFARASAGREDLVTVLNAFSHLDPQLGYYPRLADVVALLLTQMPAEESFFTLVSLVRNYGFRQFFVVGREELRLEVVAFSFLLEAVEPKISRRFRDLEIETSDYLVSWLSTCFLSILQLPTVLRIIDVFLLEPKTRYSAPLAILRLSQFTSVDLFPSRDSVLNHLLAPPPDIFTPQRLVPAIVGYKLSDDKVQKAIKMAAKEMLAPKKQR